MAPNVDDYGNTVAKAIASGTGQIIRGIFWVRDSTVVKMESGAMNAQVWAQEGRPLLPSPRTGLGASRFSAMAAATDQVQRQQGSLRASPLGSNSIFHQQCTGRWEASLCI